MIVLLFLLVCFCCRYFLLGCASWVIGLCLLGWLLRNNPSLIRDIEDVVREVLDGW
jgi:membrane protein DedA with SNARE-associated domain